jgi:4-hydroxythreonine-4-phosphate dehydrogenase
MSLIFTCGDPLSINIEAFLRVVVPGMARHRAVIGIGSRWQLCHQAKALGLVLPPIKFIDSIAAAEGSGIFWLDPLPTVPEIDARDLSELNRGRLAMAALEAVPSRSAAPMAVLTAPINKKSISLAGFKFPGQTEFFEKLWNARAVMMLAGPKLRVALATNHLRLKNVPDEISEDLLLSKINVVHAASMNMFGLKSPRIAVCGLNPHCGDGGLFGCEDDKEILPAVNKARLSGLEIKGPIPADTVFYRALQGEFDVVLAMYHDQGLGPLKTVHFDEAVNISMGLPHLRVSPDHGPASDLYLTGRASIKSFDAAAKVCERWLLEQRA